MRRDGVTFSAATKIVEASLGVRVTRDENPLPELRADAEQRVSQWHDALVGDLELLERTGIPYAQVVKHKVGWAQEYNHLGTWKVDGVVVPVYLNGKLAAVRLFVQRRYGRVDQQRPCPKALWVLERGAPAQGIKAWYPNLEGDLTVRSSIMEALTLGGIAATCELTEVNGVMKRQLDEARDRRITPDCAYWEKNADWYKKQQWSFVRYQWKDAIDLLYAGKYDEIQGENRRIVAEFIDRLKGIYGQ